MKWREARVNGEYKSHNEVNAVICVVGLMLVLMKGREQADTSRKGAGSIEPGLRLLVSAP
jgi:hypothetical protein